VKTAQEIVDEVNDVARIILLEAIGTGYEVPDGYRFDRAEGPHGENFRTRKAWAVAVEVYELITKTEVHDALIEVEEEERPS
jgi:hypothetical protein